MMVVIFGREYLINYIFNVPKLSDDSDITIKSDPGSDALRMVEGATLLVKDILPAPPVRSWGPGFTYALRILFATGLAVMGEVPGIVYRALATFQVSNAGYMHEADRTGAVKLISAS
jgi:hypothetical protein